MYNKEVSDKVVKMIKKLSGASTIIVRKGMVYMAYLFDKQEVPMKDNKSKVKNWRHPTLKYEDKGWEHRITDHWCPEHGYPYKPSMTGYEIPVPDSDKYIAIVYCKKGSVAYNALTEYGFITVEVE